MHGYSLIMRKFWSAALACALLLSGCSAATSSQSRPVTTKTNQTEAVVATKKAPAKVTNKVASSRTTKPAAKVAVTKTKPVAKTAKAAVTPTKQQPTVATQTTPKVATATVTPKATVKSATQMSSQATVASSATASQSTVKTAPQTKTVTTKATGTSQTKAPVKATTTSQISTVTTKAAASQTPTAKKVATTTWNTSKQAQLAAFMATWQTKMGQTFQATYNGQQPNHLGFVFPEVITSGKAANRIKIGQQNVQLTWSTNGNNGAAYQVVAVATGGKANAMYPTTYFFTLHNQQPIVYVTDTSNGGILYLHVATNRALQNGFAKIVDGQ